MDPRRYRWREWCLAGVLLGFTACDRADPVTPPEDPPAKEIRTISVDPPTRIEVVYADPEPDPPEPAGSNIIYEPGDTFQGMWNYDRRSASLRLTIESVDPEKRTLTATMQSSDLDDAKKEFSGAVGEDGRQLVLTGTAGTGSEYDRTPGYDVRDFLRKGSSMKIDLDDCNARQLRGSVENGTNIYFWSGTKPATARGD